VIGLSSRDSSDGAEAGAAGTAGAGVGAGVGAVGAGIGARAAGFADDAAAAEVCQCTSSRNYNQGFGSILFVVFYCYHINCIGHELVITDATLDRLMLF
jgi:hypothetical protein